MPMPSVEEFLTNVYTPEGEFVTGARLDALTNIVLPQLKRETVDGTPQIEVMVHDALSDQCRDTANTFAVSYPDIAKQIGHLGLFRIMVACVAEGKGNAPVGYTQAVMEALRAQKPVFWKRPEYWAVVGGATLLGLVLLRGRR